MEDVLKTILDVVRVQHSATEGTDEKPFDMDDIVDMTLGVMGRPDEPGQEEEMVHSIQKLVYDLAPDLFPPKSLEQMDSQERFASVTNMLEERMANGFSGRTDKGTVHDDFDQNQEAAMPSGQLNPMEAADLNDLIYKNIMEMMGTQPPQVEFPFDRSQIRYGQEKSITEQMMEEAAYSSGILGESSGARPGGSARESAGESAARPVRLSAADLANQRISQVDNHSQLSAFEIAQNAVNKDIQIHTKEAPAPVKPEPPKAKSASQLAAEAIARAQEEDRMKMEIEKQAEALMAEAAKRGQDPMKFALHQQEILRYMEKNSDELVSFEDYEDLTPEEKLELERRLHIEKQIAEGVDPDQVDTEVPEEYIPEELKKAAAFSAAETGTTGAGAATAAASAAETAATAAVSTAETAATAATATVTGAASSAAAESLPPLSDEMLRMLSREVISENADMILGENADEDMEGLQKQIFENLKNMMSGQGQPIPQEDVEALIAQAIQSSSGLPDADETNPQAGQTEQGEAAELADLTADLTAELEKTFQEEDAGQDSEESGTNAGQDSEEPGTNAGQDSEEPGTNAGQESEEPGTDAETAKEIEPAEEEGITENVETAHAWSEAEEELELGPDLVGEEDLGEEFEIEDSQEIDNSEEQEEEELYSDEVVLGEHTQAEVDEALANLDTLGLEGDVYQRAKRMLLLELANSEAELDSWLEAQKKKGADQICGSGQETDLLDEDVLEKELEEALDEDFFEEDFLNEAFEEDYSEEDDQAEAESDQAEKLSEEAAPGGEAGEAQETVEAESEEEEGDRAEAESDQAEKLSEEAAQEGESGEARETAEAVSQEVEGDQGVAGDSKKSYQVSAVKPFVLKNSASYMDQFESFIADTQENRRLSTGFRKLDGILRYGLHKGSYFIDSRPQYLKNGFMQQIADRTAETGIDVLYISTELSRYDLMLETISRLSYEIHQGDLTKAVSPMAIMTGEEGADLASLKDELNWYRGRISEHLFILDQEAVSEAAQTMEEASADLVLTELIRSIVREGAHKPVVLIDNIENIFYTEDVEGMRPLMEGMRKLAGELGIPILMSFGYAQAESDEELYPEEKEYHESLGNMCDVYMELQFAEMIIEDSVPLTGEEIREMTEEGKAFPVNVLIHRNRRPMKASLQIQATPKYNYYEE